MVSTSHHTPSLFRIPRLIPLPTTACADVVKKPKLDQHRQRCYSGFDCIDCSTTFNTPAEYKGHTQCISEAEKYEKSVYKGPKTVRPSPISIASSTISHCHPPPGPQKPLPRPPPRRARARRPLRKPRCRPRARWIQRECRLGTPRSTDGGDRGE